MLLVLLIRASVVLTVTAQQNLAKFGVATQSSTEYIGVAQNAIEPPISNDFDFTKCTSTILGNKLAWWMFKFSYDSVYITDVNIYYREGLARRMDGFRLYVSNTSTIQHDSYLCYEDGPGLPNITQTIPCYELGKYVIYYDDKGSTESDGRVDGPVIELCYVAIIGCEKGRWGSTCEQFCPENCIERNCYPGNGSCVWGCNAENCLKEICDKDTAVCTDGCKEKRTGRYCNKYNIASAGLVWQVPSGSKDAGLAIDGIETTCAKTTGPNVIFHVDLKKKSIVTEMYIILADGKTTEGHHTVYASNTSNTWNNGTVLYNGTYLPNEINFDAVFRFLTYVSPVNSLVLELELCEIGIIGCPPTHYGPFCNTTCPQNCNGPCDLEAGICILGCMNGWTDVKCDKECNNGSYGKDCLEKCSANCWNTPCNHSTGECTGGCKNGWQGFYCSQKCPNGEFGRNCSEFCEGCLSSMCHHVSGLCDNTTSCYPGYEHTEKCDIACDDGEFGIGCNQKCYCLTAPCSKEYGICPPGGCVAGFHGKSCHQECNSGMFGQNCKNVCEGCLSSMCDTINGICFNTSGCEPGYLYDNYCNKTCDDIHFGKNCTGKCNCLTGTCDIFTGICGGRVMINMAAIGGSVAVFIIIVLIIVVVFIFYKRRLIASQDTGKTTPSDTTTYETRNNTDNSHQNEPQYDDLIRMDTASPYQDLIPHSASNEYEQIDYSYVNLSVPI